ncbi:hypothetical protein M422DRAFT_42583 [Sphaerobolus stellatus SS14]|nr:hypothetical protein M422DRAFT_42583 [Sphaerobolus stellatus SS14]
MDDDTENVSYIIIHDLSPEAKMLYLSPSLTEVLGFEPGDVLGTSSFDWMHPDEVEVVKQLHYDTIREDKAAAVAYLRVQNQEDAYVSCVIQRSMVYNALIGSISFARPGAKALHTAATAQEVTICTPSMLDSQLEFRRWDERGPRRAPPPAIPPGMTYKEMFDHLPTPSERTGMILNRFSDSCPVMYCTNDCIIPPDRVRHRPFYDFVCIEDEPRVREWINAAKRWGVTDKGTPSDGGFVFGTFKMCLLGRVSAEGAGRATRTRRNGASRRDRDRTRAAAQTRDERERDSPRQDDQDDDDRSPTSPNSRRSNQTPAPAPRRTDLLNVDAIFSAHSDGFIVVLRKAVVHDD